MLISVIVTVYNTEQYLSVCLDSILSQTYKNIEVIIVDDGSIDGSFKICLDYAKVDSRIIAMRQEHSGVVEARKLGVKTSRGKYCIFVDSDDWIADKLLESVIPLTDCGSVDIVNYNMSSICGDNVTNWRYTVPVGVYEGQKLKSIYTRMIFDFENRCPGVIQSLCTKLIRREILWSSIQNEDPRISMGEDAAVVYKAMLLAKRVTVTHEIFYFYRVHEKSMCCTKDIDVFSKIYYFQKYMKNIFLNYDKKYELNEQLQGYLMLLIEKSLEDIYSLKVRNLYHIPFDILEDCQGRDIVLYGAGAVGKSFYKQLRQNMDIKIVAWVDNRLKNQKIYKYNIESPEVLEYVHFDKILIAMSDQSIVMDLKKQLSKSFPASQILWRQPWTNWWEREVEI